MDGISLNAGLLLGYVSRFIRATGIGYTYVYPFIFIYKFSMDFLMKFINKPLG